MSKIIVDKPIPAKADLRIEIIHETQFTYPEYFEIAYKHLAKVEGALSEHKNDPGGVTKYGISLRFLEDYEKTEQGRKVLTELKIYHVDRNTIVALNKEQSKRILYEAFWISPNIASLPLILSVITYDYAVNSGSFYAVKVLQKAINAHIDGIIGSQTIRLSYAANTTQAAKFMLEERAKYYIRLSNQKPKFKVFLNGWLNRVESLKDYLNSLSKSKKIQTLLKAEKEKQV